MRPVGGRDGPTDFGVAWREEDAMARKRSGANAALTRPGTTSRPGVTRERGRTGVVFGSGHSGMTQLGAGGVAGWWQGQGGDEQ